MPGPWEKYQTPDQTGLPMTGEPTVTNGAFMPALSSNTPPYNTAEDRANIALSTILPRGSVQALQNTPGHAFRMEQSKKAADTQSQLEAAQNAGRRILQSYAQLRYKFDTAPDDALTGAIGPRNNTPYASYIPFVGGMTPPEAAASYKMMPNFTGASDYDAAWNLQNLLGHDIHGITNAFMSNAGKSLNMSDTRQEAFDSTMRDFMKATNRKDSAEILDHAKGIIANDFGIPPYMADKIINDTISQIKAQHAQQTSPPTPPTVSSPDEAKKLPSGTKFLTPDGQLRMVP